MTLTEWVAPDQLQLLLRKTNHRDWEIIVTSELLNGKRLTTAFKEWGTHGAYSPFTQ